MGDALAVALLKCRGFTAEDFARSHPSGSLGKRLLLRVSDVMRSGDRVPAVRADVSLRDGLMEMTDKGLGMTAVVDDDMTLQGIFTDGDLRRTLEKGYKIQTTKIKDVMTRNYKTALTNTLAAEALSTMERFKITSLMVLNDDNQPTGVLHMHDLLTAGVV